MFADQHFDYFVNHSLVNLRKLSQTSDLLTFVMIQDFWDPIEWTLLLVNA